ncbi:TetR/AcrR family transcriptional regulator [Streptomyces sp. NPDC127084]|uniref:TetR/AcrR family transcriptional regulator n=1 Tax=Streptomyces sp. NPDC127084 TaxID=3347133 RepID=UPI0036621E28
MNARDKRDEPAPGTRGTPGTGRQPRWRRDPERTSAVLLDAVLDLVAEGVHQPTSKAIAERAGVSERSVFVHFPDRETLYTAAAERQTDRWLALSEPVPPDRATAYKVRVFLAQRGRMYERMTPIRKVGLGLEPDSPGLHRIMRWGDAWLRDDLARTFEPELGRVAGARRAGGLLDSLEAASSWAAWDHLRSRRGLGDAATRSAMGRSLRALLGDAPDAEAAPSPAPEPPPAP